MTLVTLQFDIVSPHSLGSLPLLRAMIIGVTKKYVNNYSKLKYLAETLMEDL